MRNEATATREEWKVIALLVALGSVAVYLLIGFLIARAATPALWQSARSEWSVAENVRESVMWGYVLRVLLWPVVVPVRALSDAVSRQITKLDPQERERLITEQQERIAELERELGLNR